MERTHFHVLILILGWACLEIYSTVDDKNQEICDFIPSEEDHICHKHGSNACECHRAGCQPSLTRKICVPYKSCQERFSDCPHTSLEGRCLRKNAFHLHGGVLCKNMEEETNDCDIEETLIAINMCQPAGNPVTDSRGVTYTPEINREDPLKLHHVHDSRKVCTKPWIQIPAADRELYYCMSYASYNPKGTACISYNAPPMRDIGNYELSIKFVEDYLTNNLNGRTFIVKLNDLILINDLNVYSYVGRCEPFEVIIPIVVARDGPDTKIFAEGFDPIPHDPYQDVKISFCYGSCQPTNSEHEVSAFYLAKLRTGTLRQNGPTGHRPECGSGFGGGAGGHGSGSGTYGGSWDGSAGFEVSGGASGGAGGRYNGGGGGSYNGGGGGGYNGGGGGGYNGGGGGGYNGNAGDDDDGDDGSSAHTYWRGRK